MSKRRTIQPKISDKDRFGMTFFLAAMFHGMVILGVNFSVSPHADSKTAPALDIILVHFVGLGWAPYDRDSKGRLTPVY